ncbi:MAG: DUF1553 domain-containing protein [Pirellulaceae bacterium]|nr:DUF1553 domain-containing protein [Pirellulaceae bacterium]
MMTTSSLHRHIRMAVVLSVLLLWPPESLTAQSNAVDFDREIAPILARACLHCHDATSRKGGLDLSSHASAQLGGEQGAVWIAHQAADSPLYQRVDADDMPPDAPLPDRDKELLRQWIADGAPWGTDPIDPFRYSTAIRAGYDWWAWRPLTAPTIPPGQANQPWGYNPIDAFVYQGLQQRGLQPAPMADGRALLRRLYLTLIGLPPLLSPSERNTADGHPYQHEELLGIDIDMADLQNNGPTYAMVVDRLLESPHYGERWARHWLDVVRFGESQGFERNKLRENAWRYRDWVVDAFHRDLPYDEFVRQQIAGDVLYPGEYGPLMATGFLVAGTWDQVGHKEGRPEMQQVARQDQLEELVGAIGQTFLGLTVNCARCHDHKFDPISHADYYRLAAAISGVNQEVEEAKGLEIKATDQAALLWTEGRERLALELRTFEQSLRTKYANDANDPNVASGPEGLLLSFLAEQRQSDRWTSTLAPEEGLALLPQPNGGWATRDAAKSVINPLKSAQEFSLEVWLTSANSAQQGPARIVTLSLDSGQRNLTLGQHDNSFDVRLRTTKTDSNGLPSTRTEAGTVSSAKTHVVVTFRQGVVKIFVNGRLSVEQNLGGDLSNWSDDYRLAIGDEISGDRTWRGDVHLAALYKRAISADEVAQNFSNQSAHVHGQVALTRLLSTATEEERQRFAQLTQALQDHLALEPAPTFSGVAHVPILREPATTRILQRGNPRQPGAEVTAAGLGLLEPSGLVADFAIQPDAPEAARRKELAKWLTDARNPLLARVMVNRVWHYHFGRGLVDTPSDFGYSGGRPTHPELLDYLATQFSASGWRLKTLHRQIVMSATWRQSTSNDSAIGKSQDAGNQWLWHANLRRLDGETFRDSVLAVSGLLSRQVGGPSFRDLDLSTAGPNLAFRAAKTQLEPEMRRRTIYRLWARSGTHPLLESLDCADPSVSQPRRAETITPVQSLALLNNSLMETAAGALVENVAKENADPAFVVEGLFARILGRTPTVDEQKACTELAQEHGPIHVAIILFNTNEFMFVE